MAIKNTDGYAVLASSYTDGPALSAAAAASMVPTYLPGICPSTYWQIGRMWRITASGRISCAVTTPGTARFDVRLGGTVVWDSLEIPLNTTAQTNVGWTLKVLLTCRAAGSGSLTTIIGQGEWISAASLNVAAPATGPGPGGVVVPYASAPAVGSGVNTQTALTWDVFHTQTVATGALTCHQFLLEQMT